MGDSANAAAAAAAPSAIEVDAHTEYVRAKALETTALDAEHAAARDFDVARLEIKARIAVCEADLADAEVATAVAAAGVSVEERAAASVKIATCKAAIARAKADEAVMIADRTRVGTAARERTDAARARTDAAQTRAGVVLRQKKRVLTAAEKERINDWLPDDIFPSSDERDALDECDT
jgi:hypothetical protein